MLGLEKIMVTGRGVAVIFAVVALLLGGVIYFNPATKGRDRSDGEAPGAVAAHEASPKNARFGAEAKGPMAASTAERDLASKVSSEGSASFSPASRRQDGGAAPDWSSYVDEVPRGGRPHYEGEAVAAYVSVGYADNRRIRMLPNQAGEYSRVWMQKDRVAQVSLEFVETAPGTEVAVVAEDGGSFAVSPKVSSILRVDEQQRIYFDFYVSDNPGVHRVAVRTPDGSTKLLDFWAGDPPAIQASTR